MLRAPFTLPDARSRCSGWGDLDFVKEAPDSYRGPPIGTLASPYVLLDDAGNGTSILYARPSAILEAWDIAQLDQLWNDVETALDAGHHVAGFMSYEAGLADEPRLRKCATDRMSTFPLIWFGIFDRPARIANIADFLPTPAPGTASLSPTWTQEQYVQTIEAALELISAGDIYQVNITFPFVLGLSDHPLAHYARWRVAQNAGWGGVVETGGCRLLSCSPEMFVALQNGQIFAKPMKGTMSRSADPGLDADAAYRLAHSGKDRAENLMIVDLMRNDLGRFAQPGSVKVPRLFDIEAYPTVFQMTSLVTAALNLTVHFTDLVRGIFPCGSVTGAPKIRAMEIIHALEGQARGPYTGSIGAFSPDGSCAFNVAIRTIEQGHVASEARLRVGSGIVADSLAEQEWRECLSKTQFATL